MRATPGWLPPWRSLALATVLFSTITLGVFRPTPSELAHTLPAFHGSSGDALLLVWATSHVSEVLPRDPRHLFDTNVFAPIAGTLALGDHMIGQAILGLPIWWTTHNPLLEFNLLTLGSYIAGGLTMFAYAWVVVGGGVWPALAAGLVFAFTPFRFHSPLWLQVLWTAFAPLALLAWLRFVETRRLVPWIAWVLAWTAHSLCGQYLMLYFGLLMGVVGGFALLAAPARRDPRLWIGTLAAPLVVGILLWPTLSPYFAMRGLHGAVRVGGLDTPLGFLMPGPGTWFSRSGTGAPDIAYGPGLFALGLAAFAAIIGPRSFSPRLKLPSRFLYLVQLLGVGATLALMFIPISFQQSVLRLDVIRNTNRVLFIGQIFAATFTAATVRWMMTRIPGRRGRVLAVGMLLLLLTDIGTPPRERKRIPFGPELSPVVPYLARLPPRSLVYERADNPESLTLAMYRSIFHHQRLPVGYSGFEPPAGTYLLRRLAQFPAPTAMHLLAQLGVEWVVTPSSVADDVVIAQATAFGARLDQRFATELLFDVRGVPAPPVAPPAPRLNADRWRVEVSTGAETAAALTDGDLARAWSGPAATGVTPSITIDLGARHELKAVRMYVPRGLVPTGFESTVALSVDGTTWTAVDGPFEADDLSRLLHAPPLVVPFSLQIPSAVARFVRVTNPPLTALQLELAAMQRLAREKGLSMWMPWMGAWEVAEIEVLGT